MNSRERFIKALNREIPDRVPRDISWGFSPLFYEKFKEKTGLTDYWEFFKIDHRFLRFSPTKLNRDFSDYFKERKNIPGFYTNEWGIGFTKSGHNSLHFEHTISPLKDGMTVNQAIDFPLPDFLESYRHDHFKKTVDDLHHKGLAVSMPLSQTIFEMSWMIRGFEELMMDMLEESEAAEILLDRVTDLRVSQAKLVTKAGIDVLMVGDDVGMQTSMLLSPSTWRNWLKPRLAKVIDAAKSINPDIHIFYHSDGIIDPIIDELIEIGVTVLNPIQPECIDPEEVKKKFGNRLAFWGAIGVQNTLPFGTPAEVREEVRQRMQTIGKNGGYIIGPTHFIEPEVPWENLVALFDAIEEFGYYI